MNMRFLKPRFASPVVAIFAAVFLLSPDNAIAQRAGQADPNFGGNGNGLQILSQVNDFVFIRSAAAAPGGETYAVGSGPNGTPTMLRIKKDGYLDSELGFVSYDVPNGYSDGTFEDVKVLNDGSLIAVGYLGGGGQSDIGIACKINPAGEVDPSFAAGSLMPGCLLIDHLSYATSVSIRSDAGLIIGGYLNADAEHYEVAIVRVSDAGVFDSTFANGLGAAGMPPSYVSDNYPLKTTLSSDDAITTLVDVDGVLVLVRHKGDGALDQKFSTDGAMTATQFASPLGMVIGEDDSIILAVIPDSESVRDLTLMKFQADGSPAVTFTGPDSPPGQSRITVCDYSCIADTPYFPNNLLRLSGGQLMLGASTYYEEFESTRPIAVRVNETTGMPDPTFGDIGEGAVTGVGRGIALPARLNAFSSVLRGDRLTIVGNLYDGGFRVMTTSFLGDRLMSDGFE